VTFTRKNGNEMEKTLTTLRIEHAISDYQVWRTAFDSFAEMRASAGVRSFAVRRPVDDPAYLMLDLEFDTASAAQKFAGFLEQHVWSTPASSPGLAGLPKSRILDLVPAAEG
jgi:hypothetical protein